MTRAGSSRINRKDGGIRMQWAAVNEYCHGCECASQYSSRIFSPSTDASSSSTSGKDEGEGFDHFEARILV
jgi:hypothetical protein